MVDVNYGDKKLETFQTNFILSSIFVPIFSKVHLKMLESNYSYFNTTKSYPLFFISKTVFFHLISYEPGEDF